MSSQHGHLRPDELRDAYAKARVTHSETVYAGRIWNVVQERVDLGEGNEVVRDFVDHPGAVAVLAMRGEPGAEEVLLIQQYRHPIGAREWEIPAGLLDVDGEPPHEAAARELFEEADLRAGRIDLLLDYASSPGGLSEQLRIFLARERRDETLGDVIGLGSAGVSDEQNPACHASSLRVSPMMALVRASSLRAPGRLARRSHNRYS